MEVKHNEVSASKFSPVDKFDGSKRQEVNTVDTSSHAMIDLCPSYHPTSGPIYRCAPPYRFAHHTAYFLWVGILCGILANAFNVILTYAFSTYSFSLLLRDARALPHRIQLCSWAAETLTIARCCCCCRSVCSSLSKARLVCAISHHIYRNSM